MSRQEREDACPQVSGNVKFKWLLKITLIMLGLLFIVIFTKYLLYNTKPKPDAVITNYVELVDKYKVYIDCLENTLTSQLQSLNDTLSNEAIDLRTFLDYKKSAADVFYDSINKNPTDPSIPTEINKSKQELRDFAQRNNVALPTSCDQ